MTPDHSFTLIVTAVGIGGTLGGIVIGHFLTRSWQHKQWLRDKRADDYQAVISAITGAYLALKRVDAVSLTSLFNDQMMREMESIKSEAFRVLNDRIFIAAELKRARIMDKWLYVYSCYGTPGSQGESDDAFSALTAELAKMAIS